MKFVPLEFLGIFVNSYLLFLSEDILFNYLILMHASTQNNKYNKTLLISFIEIQNKNLRNIKRFKYR